MTGLHNRLTFSVVVATHHRPRLLQRALRSLTGQSFQDFEILVCADEATEETLSAAQSVLRPQDSLMALPGHTGPAATRNFGVRAARGRWVCFLDDDDSLGPDYFASAAPLIEAQPLAVHHFDHTLVLESRVDEIIELRRTRIHSKGRPARALEVHNFIPNNAFFVPAAVAKRHDIDEQLQSHEDWDHLIALSRVCEFVHHGLAGPNVHTSEERSRNKDAKASNSIILDYMSIYRKWPASSGQVRLERREALAALGIDLSPQFL